VAERFGYLLAAVSDIARGSMPWGDSRVLFSWTERRNKLRLYRMGVAVLGFALVTKSLVTK
jgi:hypothetical protein